MWTKLNLLYPNFVKHKNLSSPSGPLEPLPHLIQIYCLTVSPAQTNPLNPIFHLSGNSASPFSMALHRKIIRDVCALTFINSPVFLISMQARQFCFKARLTFSVCVYTYLELLLTFCAPCEYFKDYDRWECFVIAK